MYTATGRGGVIKIVDIFCIGYIIYACPFSGCAEGRFEFFDIACERLLDLIVGD